MALNQRDLFARAFALRRALTTRADGPACGPHLNGCDALLLSLILDQERVRSLEVGEDALAATLADAFNAAGRSDAPALNPPGGERAGLALVRWGTAPDARSGSLVLAYAVPDEVPLAADAGREPLWLTPLASTFAAAWSSRLAWLASAATRAETALAQRRLAGLLPPDELDPLFLLDALQAGRGGSDPDGASSRVRALEQRVRELETSGLVRYQTLLGDAARRRRHEP